MMTSHPPRLLAVAMVFLLVLVACAGPAATPSPTGAPSPTATPAAPTATPQPTMAQPEISELRVGVIPIVDVAPVHLAINEGLFAAEGLTVTAENMAGGAAAIPALQGGDLHIAFGAWPSFLVANQQGIELRAVADGVSGREGFTEFLALPDSGLEGNPAGMAGKTVALNTLGNVGELALRYALREAGVDYSQVTALEVPFPEMGAALDSGNVHVIWTPEPGVTGSKTNLGAVTVAPSYVGDMENFPVAGYFVTREFAEQNPNTVAAFVRAVEAASQMANEDSELLHEVVGTYTTLPPPLIAQLSYPEYHGALEVATLQRVYDLLVEFEMIQEGLDVGSLVLTGN